MDVTVYTKPNCPQCDQTKRLLTRDNVKYDEEPIGDEERQLFLGHGFMSAPIVVVSQPVAPGVSGVKEFGDGVAWAGLNPDALKQLVEKYHSA